MPHSPPLGCFKTYDIRGRLGETLDPDIVRRIGAAFAHVLAARHVVVGYDARASSPELCAALVEGILATGADVSHIGLCGTEEVYFATGHLGADGGVMVTASHNPIDYNGMKFVGPGSRPIDPSEELPRIREAAEAQTWGEAASPGTCRSVETRSAYADLIAGFGTDLRGRRFRILANPGNGTAGAAFDAVLDRLTRTGAVIDVVRLHFDPDPTFPNGIPNPLLPENREATAQAVRDHGAELGVAWDGDFDRCFFFDEHGEFVDGEYVVALLAKAALSRDPGATVVCDPRVVWATTDAVETAGGRRTLSKTGHAFIKARMRETQAAYGGEMSAHHYFREFFHCDSGMIPWVLMLNVLAQGGQPLSGLVADMRRRFPSSGEINFSVAEPSAVLSLCAEVFGKDALEVDHLDGVSLTFENWRMNIRASNTEPLLRLNIETREDQPLLREKVAEVSRFIHGAGALTVA